MTQELKAKIFLADQRGINETDKFRSRPTFNFGNYFNEHKQAFENIYVLNDDTLAGGCKLTMLVTEYSYVILIPVAGAINCKHNEENENLIVAGQSYIIRAEKGTVIEIGNPFNEEHVNFLQIWIRSGREDVTSSKLHTYEDVTKNVNNFVRATGVNDSQHKLPFSISIGKFSGRGETVYLPQNKRANLLVFVIEGAFEIEGRLLHARDTLTLWNAAQAETEALSNDAIMMIIELSTTGSTF